MKLTSSQKRHRATLLGESREQTDLGTQVVESEIATVRGSFRKSRGGLNEQDGVESMTRKATFACDYRPAFLTGVKKVAVGDAIYDVTDVTNMALANHTLLFDLELKDENND